MSKTPTLCVIVPLPTSSRQLGDLIWSLLRQRTLSAEFVVVADEQQSPEAAALVRKSAAVEPRLRLIDGRSDGGPLPAIAAALDATTAPFVTVAEPDGMCVDGSYEALLATLRATGSDMAVGAAESFVKDRKRLSRAADGALETDLRGIRLAELPGLIADDLLSTKILRRDLLRDAIAADTAASPREVAARAYVSADRIDVHSRSIFWCRRDVPLSTGSPLSPEWAPRVAATRTVVSAADARVRECFARTVLEREVLHKDALAWLPTSSAGEAMSALVRDLADDLVPTSLSHLSSRHRWRLALLALGSPQLLDHIQSGRSIDSHDVPELDMRRLSAPAWGVLGIGRTDVRTAFVERFARTPEVSVPPAAEGEDVEISIVIPTFNVAPYIDELLDSIRVAVGVRLEVIVVDDWSTDGTWDRIAAHVAEDPRIRSVRSAGRGGGQARNLGVELARGEYLAFADGDDLIPPRAYADMLAMARRSGADVVSGNYLKFMTTSTWDAAEGFNHAYALAIEGASLDQHPQLARHRAVWNRLVRREHWARTAFPFPGVPRSNDIVAMMSVLLTAESVAVTPTPVYIYRDRPGTGSMTSAGGSADYTVSYFAEETTCAALVRQRESEPVEREYWSMVLIGDAWGNILKYLGRRTGDVGEDDRVAERIAALLARAPRREFLRLSAEYQAVWLLSAAGLFSEAAVISQVMKSGSKASLADVAAAITAAVDLNDLPRPAASRLVLRHLLRRIVTDAAWQTPAVRHALPVMQRVLTDPVAPMAVVPVALEARSARAALDGEAAKVIRSLSPSSHFIPAELRSGIDGGELSGTSFSDGYSPARIVARPYGDTKRDRIPVGFITFDREKWSTTIDHRVFPRTGVWVVEIEYEDRWGMRRSPLALSDAAGQRIPGALRRAVIARTKKQRSLIRLRSALGERIRAKIRQRLRR